MENFKKKKIKTKLDVFKLKKKELNIHYFIQRLFTANTIIMC